MKLLHPVQSRYSRERLRDEYQLLTFNNIADRQWHFKAAVSRNALQQPGGKGAPRAGRMTQIAHFTHRDPSYTLEIAGQISPYEVNACDFLDAWIDHQSNKSPVEVISRVTLPSAGGLTGDAVVTGEHNGIPWAGRIVCLKYGPRFVMLSFRTSLSNYDALADEFFVTIMTFQMLDQTMGVLAERVQWINGMHPAPWKLAVPISCEIQPQTGDNHFAEFAGKLMADGGKKVAGELSATIVEASAVSSATEAVDLVRQAARGAGAEQTEVEFIPATPDSRQFESWALNSPANTPQGPRDLRIRLLHHPRAWICAVVMGPPRLEDTWSWMRNKRMMDLVSLTAQIG